MANNKDFKVKNGIQPTVYHEGVGTVTSGSTTIAYDVANISFDSKTFDVSSQAQYPAGVAFKSDGTKMYVAGAAGTGTGDVFQYSLSTAWDISTASYDSISYSNGSITNAYTIQFKPDGTKLFIQAYEDDRVYEHTLSTAWDLSTASYNNNNLYYGGQTATAYDFHIGSNGTKVYVSNNDSPMYQYTCSTAWDLSTATYDSVTLDVSGETPSDGWRVQFNADGTKMYGMNADDIYIYTLTTAWDISTASYDSVNYTMTNYTSHRNFVFKDDGTKIYASEGSSSGKIAQYSTGSTLTTNTLDLSTGSVFEITPTSDIQIGLSNPAASGTVSAATLLLDGAADVTPYDLANAAYDSKSLNVGAQGLNPYGLALSTDGTKLYSVSYATNTVYQYTLSTAWDLSTASYAAKSFSVSSTAPQPHAIRFKSDGTKMYVTDNNVQEVNEYDLSTAWDVSTASHSYAFSISSQGSEPAGLDFKTDGTKMYVAFASGTDSIAEYNLSTAWDLSTASYSQNSTTINTTSNVGGIMFKNDGTVLYTTSRFNSEAINEYSLSTAWDISTLTYVRNFSVSSEENDPTDLYIKPDGTKMYMVGYSTDYVYQYSLASSVGYTITYHSTLQWGGGTAPDSPAIGETDVITFTTRDGGTTYQAAIAIDGAA